MWSPVRPVRAVSSPLPAALEPQGPQLQLMVMVGLGVEEHVDIRLWFPYGC